ncbi:MAG: 3-keto-5-aminohexanoate cleavage enzyme [Candidatus Rokuibacteriota bacterium]|nr:MAG: 3-keto-5-aminohexanoate cleavage enzyme [Candidatus Rokubacteria bacterium]
MRPCRSTPRPRRPRLEPRSPRAPAAIHLHVCGPAGPESLAARDVAHTLQAVRRACAAVPVGISTAAWIVPGEGDRLAGGGLGDLARLRVVNFDEKGAVELAERLLARGVGVEAGLADVHAVEVLVRSSVRDRCFRILLEPLEQAVDAAQGTVAGMEASLDRAHVWQPRLLHGLDATAWHFVREAATKGYDTRVGFEDVLVLPDGHGAPDNAALVAAARALVAAAGR